MAVLIASAAAAAFAVGVFGGCTHGCDEGGCSGGVSLRAVDLREDLPGARRLRLCIGDECASGAVGKYAEAALSEHFVSEQEEVELMGVVLDDSGRRILTATRVVPVNKNQPNGPNCEPTCYSVSTKLDASSERLVLR